MNEKLQKKQMTGGINNKLLLIFTAISVLPVLILGYTFFSSVDYQGEQILNSVSTQLEHHSKMMVKNDVKNIAENITLEIEDNKEYFESISINSYFTLVLEDANKTGEIFENRFYPADTNGNWEELQEQFAKIYSKKADEIDMIRLFHKNGYIVNGIILGEEDSADYKGDKSWFQDTLDSKKIKSDEAYISPISIARRTNTSAIRYSIPVENAEGERIGVFVINFKSDSITKKIEEYYFEESEGKGYAMLIDTKYETAEGKIIEWPVTIAMTTPEGRKFQINESEYAKAEFGEADFNGNSGEISFKIDNENAKAFYEKVNIEGKNWFVVIALKESDLKNLAKNSEVALIELEDNLISSVLLLIFATLILVFASAAFFSDSISKPIKILKKTAEEVEKGNFHTRAIVKTNDELEEFAITFNKTIEHLENTEKEHKQLDRAKTEFLSITSHELRSPMTPMRAQLQMLKENYFGKLTKKQEESLDIVLRNTERLDKIIVDFLEISRIEAARLKFRFVKTNIEEHITRLVEEMNGFLPEKKIKITTQIDKIPKIELDPDRLMQVLRNLINNAKKFSPEKTEISLSAKKAENEIIFSVKDSGIGIAEENKKRVFEPFFQEEQTMYRKYSGTGLGLAICKGIIESQNGRIWLDSEKGKGTTFYFTVPFKPVREIKPIKLLFSEDINVNSKIKKLFIKVLGPLGEKEFKELEKIKKIEKKEIIDYFEKIQNEKIIDEKTKIESINNIKEIFGENKTDLNTKNMNTERDLK